MQTQQGTPAWFNARKGKLTASRFGAAAGICPFASRAKCLRETIGIEKWKGNLDACKWGTTNEPNAIKDYMVRTGNVVTRGGFYEHPHHTWLGGSPDGLVGERGMIEVKCPFVKQTPHVKVPPHYYCQMNGLMEILDRDWCDFVTWTPTEMRIYRVWRDPELWDFLLDRYMIFYAFMKRGCSTVPRMTDKQQVLDRIAASDALTSYRFWEYMEPGPQRGRWEAPPDEDFEWDEDSPSSKRSRNDTSSVRLMCSAEAAPLDDCPGPGVVLC